MRSRLTSDSICMPVYQMCPDIRVGDVISVTWQANLVNGNYVWRWDTIVYDEDCRTRVKANFKQSSFFSAPLSLELLRKRAENYVPRLNQDAAIDSLALAAMKDDLSLGAIAQRLLLQFPKRFANWQEALTHAGEISDKYSL